MAGMVGYGWGTMPRQRGFTLIEMAFVIAIVGMMVGGGLFAFTAVTERANLITTNGNLDQVEASLVLFAIRNNRLPCPADGHLTSSGGGNYGKEQIPTSSGTCTIANTNSVIPWITLGLDEGRSYDGWGTRISYFPANPTIGTGITTLVDNSGGECLSRIGSTTTPPAGFRSATTCDPSPALNSTGNYGTYGIPTYPYNAYIPVYSAAASTTTEITGGVNPTGAAVATPVTSANYISLYGLRAAYVLISHGPSRWYGWSQNGTQFAAPGAFTLKSDNNSGTAGAGIGFYQGLPQGTQSQSNYFDDIVRWRSPAYIIQQCGSVACGNP